MFVQGKKTLKISMVKMAIFCMEFVKQFVSVDCDIPTYFNLVDV